MPRFRKSKAQTTNPPAPAELAPKFMAKRALAASSTAIALSIGSAFHDTGEASSNATVRERNMGWHMAYDAARMAVEIAKESSDLCPLLKAVTGVMSVLIKNHDQGSDNVEGVKETERRVQLLSDVLAFPVSENDYAEKERRAELRRKFEGAVAKLQPPSDQHALVGFLRNIDNAKTLTGFVQELANAITDYQVSVQRVCDTKNILGDNDNTLSDTKNILDYTKNMLEAADLEILAKLEPVRNAGYQAGHHDKCLPGTRQSVLQDIMDWATNPRDQNVFWLNGLAGTGKSTIAQSFSETVASEGFLGANFFCSRDYLNRRELKNIFPTLSHQLACRYPHFRNRIINVIKKDPTLAHTSLISQLENLLVNPLSEAKISCVIVIDALDECIDDQPASAILSVLGRFAKQLPLVKFFITGRPEPRIRTGFRLPLLEPITHIFLLHEVELSTVDSDIQLYLTQRLAAIAKRRSDVDLPDPWPHDGEILVLTKKSSGLFIFASTLVRFIESEHHDPSERLQLVLSEAGGTTHEGRTGIDFLYSQVLLLAFSDVCESEVFANMRRVLGAIVLAFNPLSRRDLSKILGVSTALVSTALRHLHSVILVPPDEHKEIRIFHKSFPDFLQDGDRCTDHRFRVYPSAHHGDMVLGCLELVERLKRNPCSLPPFTMNRDVSDLPQLLEERLGGAVRYACRYWARHLELSPKSGDHIPQAAKSVTRVLGNAPPWIEVMSLDNHLEEVIHSMYRLLDWRDENVISTAQTAQAQAAQEAEDAAQEAEIAAWKAEAAAQKAEVAAQEAEAAWNAQVAAWKAEAAVREAEATQTRAEAAQTRAEAAQTRAKAVHEAEAAEVTEEAVAAREAGAAREAKAEAEVAQKAKAEADSVVSAITTLYDLATDCLRLSMHFFHPIQQCAQQIYHSALPLSPMSSKLRISSLRSVMDDQLSYVTAFLGAPDTWGLLLRVIDVRPSQLTCITTFPQRIVAACGDVVNIYDAVTFVLRQSLSTLKTAEKIHGSPHGSILFAAHSLSITMWDVQTGGLIHTFTTQSKINDTAVSTTGDHIACILSNGSVVSWNAHTQQEIRRSGNGQPVETILWLSSTELAVATLSYVCVWDITDGNISNNFPTPSYVWGMVRLADAGEFLVGVEVTPGLYTFETFEYESGHLGSQVASGLPTMTLFGGLARPTLVDNQIACITPPSGVRLFDIVHSTWTDNIPLLSAAISIAISSNRNIVVQTNDSIQILSADVLKSREVRENIRSSRIYPLGEIHIVCVLEPSRRLILLELETLRELRPGDEAPPLRSLLTNISPSARALFGRGLIAQFDVSVVMEAWQLGTPLPGRAEAADEDAPLSALSPSCTRVVTIVHDSLQWKLRLKYVRDGATLAKKPLELGDLGMGEVYDLTFDSETRFHLKIDGPGWHLQIPYDIIPSWSGSYSHTITRGEPVPLSEPRVKPPYTLDANCEWVIDAELRKVCWVSPGNVRRGNGGHFWAGLSLVMVGDDGVVRKLTFKQPDC